MKNKPSLIDIEAFIQTRTKEKEEELAKVEEDSQLLDHFQNNILDHMQDNRDDVPIGSESAVYEMMKAQNTEVQQLKSELFKIKAQIRIIYSLLNTQPKKESGIETPTPSEEKAPSEVAPDDHYVKLILQNVVWLKEEKGFSSNDVVKLFSAEGFQPPPPYTVWDTELVSHLYVEYKRKLLF
ncbi:MAG: hypothetical protein HQ517_17410 [SAR324 cluster bacterium]|nr:hypothetical protein [SAR324 cluster bacterium]